MCCINTYFFYNTFQFAHIFSFVSTFINILDLNNYNNSYSISGAVNGCAVSSMRGYHALKRYLDIWKQMIRPFNCANLTLFGLHGERLHEAISLSAKCQYYRR